MPTNVEGESANSYVEPRVSMSNQTNTLIGVKDFMLV